MSIRCRHSAAALAGAACLVACAAPSQTAAPARSADLPPRPTELREEFDPEPYRDDALLIQPEFGPPVSARSLDTPAPTPLPPLESTPAPADASADTAAVELEPLPAAPDSTSLYRVQVMALSTEEAAENLAGKLRQRLSAPVIVHPEGELFLVRAGESTSPTVAEALRVRLVGLGSQYAGAYVIAEQVAVEPTWDPGLEDADDVPPPDEAPAPVAVELVRTSGWRVLLDQFQGYREATSFRQSALRRLQRNSIEAAVDIVFAAPWYKVEAGNFRTSAGAQALVERVKGLGYRNALKVRDEVYLPREDD